MTSGGGVPYGRASCSCCPASGAAAYAASATTVETQSHPSLRIVGLLVFLPLLSRALKRRAVDHRRFLGRPAALSRTLAGRPADFRPFLPLRRGKVRNPGQSRRIHAGGGLTGAGKALCLNGA